MHGNADQITYSPDSEYFKITVDAYIPERRCDFELNQKVQ